MYFYWQKYHPFLIIVISIVMLLNAEITKEDLYRHFMVKIVLLLFSKIDNRISIFFNEDIPTKERLFNHEIFTEDMYRNIDLTDLTIPL